MTHAVYGAPPAALALTPTGAVQTSPLVLGSTPIEDLADGSLDSFTLLAPPGVVERRYALAYALRALKPTASLVALALKDKGGSRIGKDLAGFGCAVDEQGKRHYRICSTVRPDMPTGLEAAIAEGAPRLAPGLGLWSQPGVFSWDRVDPGSRLLADTMPPLSGKGADFGAGLGVLAHKVLASPAVTALTLVDLDRRAVEAARRNVVDARATILWDDVRRLPLADLDFVVTNPPFHDGGAEEKGLGQGFIVRAAAALRKGGRCWLVANRHLPYEAILAEHFAAATLKADAGGYKVYEARK